MKKRAREESDETHESVSTVVQKAARADALQVAINVVISARSLISTGINPEAALKRTEKALYAMLEDD